MELTIIYFIFIELNLSDDYDYDGDDATGKNDQGFPVLSFILVLDETPVFCVNSVTY